MTTLRPVRLPDDLEVLWEIAVACEAEVIDEVVTTHEDIRAQVESTDGDLVDGLRVAVDDVGHAVGFVTTEVDEPGLLVQIDAYARPGAGAEVLDELLGHALAYARRRAAAAEESGWAAGGGVFPTDTAYVAALTRHGMAPVRRFYRMRVDLDGPVDVPELAGGVEISAVGEDEPRQQIIHELLTEAFSEHWRHTTHTWPDFIAYVRNVGYDASQWLLASVDGQPAGALIGNDTQVELGAGYVSMLGVLKPFRGQGIGRALLLTAFAESARRGLTSVRLGVDTENGTGAPALYAGVGMTPAETIDFYELPLD